MRARAGLKTEVDPPEKRHETLSHDPFGSLESGGKLGTLLAPQPDPPRKNVLTRLEQALQCPVEAGWI